MKTYFKKKFLLLALLITSMSLKAQVTPQSYVKAKRVEAIDSLRLRGVWYKSFGGLVDSIKFRSSTFVDTVYSYGNGGTPNLVGYIDRESALIDGGVIVYNQTQTNYTVTAATYIINGNRINSLEQNFSIDPIQNIGGYKRFDVIGLDIDGNVFVIKGEEDFDPVQPQVDPTTQLYLTCILVNDLNNTEPPPNFTRLVIYDENQEWTTSANNVFISIPDFNDNQAPYLGSINIKQPAFTINFSDLSKPISHFFYADGDPVFNTTYDRLVLHIKSYYQLSDGAQITAQFTNVDGSVLTNAVPINQLGAPVLSSDYKTYTIPLSSFIWPTTPPDDVNLKINFRGTTTQEIFIDDIELQGGVPQGSGGGSSGSFVTSVFINDGKLYYKKNGTDYLVGEIGGSGGGSTPQNLQQVTDQGNWTTNSINIDNSFGAVRIYGLLEAVTAELSANSFTNTDGTTQSSLKLGNGVNDVKLSYPKNLSADLKQYLPSQSGTLALLSDIPTATGLPYKKAVLKTNQSGGLIVLYNNTGLTFSISNVATGRYDINASGLIDCNKAYMISRDNSIYTSIDNITVKAIQYCDSQTSSSDTVAAILNVKQGTTAVNIFPKGITIELTIFN